MYLTNVGFHKFAVLQIINNFIFHLCVGPTIKVKLLEADLMSFLGCVISPCNGVTVPYTCEI